MSEKTKVSGLPKQSTLRLTPGQRAMGRMVEIGLNGRPSSQPEEDLAGDTFQELYLQDPQPLEEPPAERALNRSLLDWMRNTHGWQQSKANTSGNLPASLISSSLMWDHLTNDETIQEALKKQEEAEQEKQEAKKRQAQADALRKAAGATGDQDLQAQADAAQAAADSAQAAADQAAAEAQAIVDEARDKPFQDAKMAKATRQAATEAKETADAVAGWGMGPGSVIQQDPKAAMDFLRQNKGKIAKIAKLAGRMRGFALQAKRERTPRGIVPTEVGMTQDLRRVFPTELAMLRKDAPQLVRAQQVAKWADGGLLGYRPTGDAEKQGPFVAAVDVSPSMRGGREIVAKAVALGVAQTAKQDGGRDYILFAFASDESTIQAVASGDSWQDHMEWVGSGQRGGTDFDMAMRHVMDYLAELPGNGRNADALFISDGEAGVATKTRNRWATYCEAHGTRLFYVPVGRGGYYDIEEVADQVVEVNELDEETGADLAGQLGRWM